MHNDFTLLRRKVPSGKKVVYYYAYDDEGQRLGPWTTGQVSKTAARNYCNRLNREGKLIPTQKKSQTFKAFSENFWDWENSPYLKERMKRKDLTKAYAEKNKKVVDKHINHYFGKMVLSKITPEVIEKWFEDLSKRKLKNTTINGYYTILKTMLKWAVKKRILQRDPTLGIEKLSNDRKALKIITPGEFKSLFCSDWQRVWNNDRIIYVANKLAALTGMRTGEVLGLKGEFVFDSHIFLCAQYDEYGYRPTKTKVKHNIPLLPEMIKELKGLKAINGNGFIFSYNSGETPMSRKSMYAGFRLALNNIGITNKEIAERGLNLHAWRHFCSTELQKGGMSIQQVQAVTGHKSSRMTEWYTHFNPMDFGEVIKVQAALLEKDNSTL